MKKFISMLSIIIVLSIFTIFSLPSSAAENSKTAGMVTTASSSLNVRSGMSTTSAVIGSLARNSYVTLISKSGSWWYVEYAAGKFGYAHADYITPVNGSYEAYVNTASSNLNVRIGAGTNFAVKDSLPKGAKVIVISQANGWSRILYKGTQTGYVSSNYLGTNSANTVKYPYIKLNVPKYSQIDSRWSGHKIANSTIAKIGCATTSLAMTESYRTGTTIYPDAMAKRLSYTPDGAVYWPSNYVSSTSSNYLENIYALLKAGKPVIVGGKKSNGSMHFVVVTGFIGGNTLAASNFTVNDSGSAYRTNLQHLFNEYPNFYKIIYYV
ncbi:MAG TPA: SH3 domain-containing protein [Clostridiales bacterium]|nr:SH3 domain-containing protein [Clostridiales bacterium]